MEKYILHYKNIEFETLGECYLYIDTLMEQGDYAEVLSICTSNIEEIRKSVSNDEVNDYLKAAMLLCVLQKIEALKMMMRYEEAIDFALENEGILSGDRKYYLEKLAQLCMLSGESETAMEIYDDLYNRYDDRIAAHWLMIYEVMNKNWEDAELYAIDVHNNSEGIDYYLYSSLYYLLMIERILGEEDEVMHICTRIIDVFEEDEIVDERDGYKFVFVVYALIELGELDVANNMISQYKNMMSQESENDLIIFEEIIRELKDRKIKGE